ncbi:ATP-dependent DNA ligase (plasmid) [Streptomyces sp. NBC_01166]|uniref:ATP-dependent DNA ligase n=1 Tax=Streptomyces sp. NBC_01166 TaxID=2903755 RepID=UPI00386670C0|nr:ATP-dependent DNA ligase [Streptomyces sp. NBC_01166]
MLAQARETIPLPGAVPGGMAVDPKFDGFRALLFTPLDTGQPVLLQSRRGAMYQARFPDLIAAAEDQLPPGLVLDGELAVLENGQLSFAALQRRARTVRQAKTLAAELPAHFIAFDILQLDGQELLDQPQMRRRQILEALFADHRLTPPWTLCPTTTDPAVAQEWLTEWTDVPGVEGVVVKSRVGRYRPGVRGSWYKVRRRATTEAIIGGITGSLRRPQVLLLGRFDAIGRLRLVGKTVPLKSVVAAEVADQLTAADTDHPWAGVRFSARWGSRDDLDPVLVEPRCVAELSGDTAQDAGVWRHPVRYVRLRQDMTAADVPTFGDMQPHTG